ncbi:MAG: metal ABC transporter ATP-binding protein [Hyphomicrobiaceae bacterium]|nr:metal ABC transporter ATP-binding protein [Hyphomicrobiaceae bacterium]
MPTPPPVSHAAHDCGHHGHHHHSGGHHTASGVAAADIPPQRLLVSARGLTYTRGGKPILTGVDLDIVDGEIVTLIGPNGAGKTSLVRLLLGLETPDRGVVTRRRGLVVGYVPQRFPVDTAFPITVARFLALGIGGQEGAAARVLAEVGASHVAGQQLASLSGGELQRVLIARALLRDPQLMVLDEPVRGVDAAGEAELYGLIARLRARRGFAVLLVSHDLHVVMGASDRVLCVNRHICCSGVPKAVARHPEYARLFGKQLADAYAVYEHHHDHAHALSGEAVAGDVAAGDVAAGDAVTTSATAAAGKGPGEGGAA